MQSTCALAAPLKSGPPGVASIVGDAAAAGSALLRPGLEVRFFFHEDRSLIFSGVVEPIQNVGYPEIVWCRVLTTALVWRNSITAAPIYQHDAFTNARDEIRFIVLPVARLIYDPKGFHQQKSIPSESLRRWYSGAASCECCSWR